MQQLKRTLPLFVIVFVLTGISMFSSASTEQRRAQQVDAIPVKIDCQSLIRQGPPDNRHIRLTDYWSGSWFAYQEISDSRDWHFLYLPLYPRNVEQEDAGRNVHLIAYFTDVRNVEELNKATSNAELTGFLWDNHRVMERYQEILRENYPELDFQRCRVFEVGDPLPTLARARIYCLGGVAAFAAAVALAFYLAYCFVGERFGWNAGSSELDACQSSSALNQALLPRDRRSAMAQSICMRLNHLLFPAGMIGGLVFWILMRTGIVSGAVGQTGIAVCATAMLIVAFMTMLPRRTYHEFIHEPLEPHQLSRRTQRYFDRYTSEIERLGFERVGDGKLLGTIDISARRFLSSDQKTVASLSTFSGGMAISCSSVTNDGVCLETSDFDASSVLDRPVKKKRYQCIKGAPEDLWTAHLRMLREHENTNLVEALAIRSSQIPALLDYDHRVIGWVMYRKGYHRSPPPPLPEFDSMETLARLMNGGLPAPALDEQLAC